MTDAQHLESILQGCTREQRAELFRMLREEFSIHPLEEQLHAKAEVILEAIQLAPEITLRMLRGVIAEAAFHVEVAERLQGWRASERAPGSFSYDSILSDGNGDVRVQVKLQRSKQGRPMHANEGFRFLPSDMYLVETQKTRKGEKKGGSTRPYRFGEFDVLAVATYPSTKRWGSFMFTVGSWLLPNPADATEILKYQPVAMSPNNDWTDDFRTAAAWFRSGQRKTIHPCSVPRSPKKRGKKKRTRRKP
jgi:hypothetical protein